MTTTPNPGPTHIPRGFEINPRKGAAATRASAVSREDSLSQAILKFQRPSSLDYRVKPWTPGTFVTFKRALLILKLAPLHRLIKTYFTLMYFIPNKIMQVSFCFWKEM